MWGYVTFVPHHMAASHSETRPLRPPRFCLHDRPLRLALPQLIPMGNALGRPRLHSPKEGPLFTVAGLGDPRIDSADAVPKPPSGEPRIDPRKRVDTESSVLNASNRFGRAFDLCSKVSRYPRRLAGESERTRISGGALYDVIDT